MSPNNLRLYVVELNLVGGLPPNLLAYLPGPSHTKPPSTNRPVSASHILTQAASEVPQRASPLLPKPRTYPTPCSAMNGLLSSGVPPLKLNGAEVILPTSEGGLRPMHVLEISGPPGSGRGCLTLELIRSAVGRGEEVLVAGEISSLEME